LGAPNRVIPKRGAGTSMLPLTQPPHLWVRLAPRVRSARRLGFVRRGGSGSFGAPGLLGAPGSFGAPGSLGAPGSFAGSGSFGAPARRGRVSQIVVRFVRRAGSGSFGAPARVRRVQRVPSWGPVCGTEPAFTGLQDGTCGIQRTFSPHMAQNLDLWVRL